MEVEGGQLRFVVSWNGSTCHATAYFYEPNAQFQTMIAKVTRKTVRESMRAIEQKALDKRAQEKK